MRMILTALACLCLTACADEAYLQTPATETTTSVTPVTTYVAPAPIYEPLYDPYPLYSDPFFPYNRSYYRNYNRVDINVRRGGNHGFGQSQRLPRGHRH